jgi:hypothetical protein
MESRPRMTRNLSDWQTDEGLVSIAARWGAIARRSYAEGTCLRTSSGTLYDVRRIVRCQKQQHHPRILTDPIHCPGLTRKLIREAVCLSLALVVLATVFQLRMKGESPHANAYKNNSHYENRETITSQIFDRFYFD